MFCKHRCKIKQFVKLSQKYPDFE